MQTNLSHSSVATKSFTFWELPFKLSPLFVEGRKRIERARIPVQQRHPSKHHQQMQLMPSNHWKSRRNWESFFYEFWESWDKLRLRCWPSRYFWPKGVCRRTGAESGRQNDGLYIQMNKLIINCCEWKGRKNGHPSQARPAPSTNISCRLQTKS